MIRIVPEFREKRIDPQKKGSNDQTFEHVIAIAQTDDEAMLTTADIARFAYEGQDTYVHNKDVMRGWAKSNGINETPSNVDENYQLLPGKKPGSKQPAKWLGSVWKEKLDGILYNKAVDVINEATYLNIWHMAHDRVVAIFYDDEARDYLQVDFSGIDPYEITPPFSRLPWPEKGKRKPSKKLRFLLAPSDQRWFSRKVLSGVAILLLLALSLVTWHLNRETQKTIVIDDTANIIASFSWPEDGAMLLRTGEVIQVGDRIEGKGKVKAISDHTLICETGEIVAPSMSLLGHWHVGTPSETSKVYNVGIRTLEPIFEAWGYRCDFRANHQITLLKKGLGSPRDFIEFLEDKGVIFIAGHTLATIGKNNAFIFGTPGYYYHGTKEMLATRYQPHVPYKLEVVRDKTEFTMPLLQPTTAASFFLAEGESVPVFPEPALDHTPPQGCSIEGDQLYLIDKGRAWQIELTNGEAFAFPPKNVYSIVHNKDLVLVTSWTPEAGFFSTIYHDGVRIDQVNGGALHVSYAKNKIYADWNVWNGREKIEKVLKEIRLTKEGLIVTDNHYFDLPSIYERLLFNRKGWWVINWKERSFVLGALEPILHPLTEGSPEVLDLPNYQRPPSKWFFLEQPSPSPLWRQKYIKWLESFTVIAGAWSYDSNIYVACIKGPTMMVTDGKAIFPLEQGESCAGIWQNNLVIVKSRESDQETGSVPSWRKIPL